jgi:hypothetical protein
MSGARRAYNILRGYVMKEWERIQGVEKDLAEQELHQAMNDPTKRGQPPPKAEVYERVEDAEAAARRLLGVAPNATFAQIRQAFERLNKRSDPKNFPNDSPEQEQAAQIQKRVNWAYTTLTDSVDTTQKRFRTLEIE